VERFNIVVGGIQREKMIQEERKYENDTGGRPVK
jgi:hypothetical protein